MGSDKTEHPAVSGREGLGSHGESLPVAWTQRTAILGNTVLTRQILLVVVITVGIMEGSFFLVSGHGLPLAPLAVGLAILLGLMALAIVLLFGNRYTLEVFLDEHGVRYLTGASERHRTRVLLAVAAFVGSPKSTAAGLTAASSERGGFPWEMVGRARIDSRERRIILYRFAFPLVELECPGECFNSVVELVRRRVTRVLG